MLEYIDRHFLHVSFWGKQAKGRILFVGPFILLNEAIHFLWACVGTSHDRHFGQIDMQTFLRLTSKALLECQSSARSHVLQLTMWRGRGVSPAEIRSRVSCSENFHRQTFSHWGSINDWQKQAKLIRQDRLFQCWVYSQGHLIMVMRQYSFNSVTVVQPLSSTKRIKIGQHGQYSIQQYSGGH